MEKIEGFLIWAEDNGWKVQRRIDSDINLINDVASRYPRIPQEALEFLKHVEYCVTPDEGAWFICLKEFNGTSDYAFKWDEIERMSLIEGDDDYNKDIVEFWDKHLPIILSVRNDYEYYAVDVHNDFGVVVHSFEPYFKEPSKVSQSFFSFLDNIMAKKIEI